MVATRSRMGIGGDHARKLKPCFERQLHGQLQHIDAFRRQLRVFVIDDDYLQRPERVDDGSTISQPRSNQKYDPSATNGSVRSNQLIDIKPRAISAKHNPAAPKTSVAPMQGLWPAHQLKEIHMAETTTAQDSGFWADKTGLIREVMDAKNGPGARGVFVVLVASDILKTAVASRALVEPNGPSANGAGQHLRFAFSELCGEISGWLMNFEEKSKSTVVAKPSGDKT